MNRLPVLLAIHFLFGFNCFQSQAETVTVTHSGSVSLSELDDYPEDDTVTVSFTYDTEANGEVFTSSAGDLTQIEYTNISAEFSNASGTLTVVTENASIFVTLQLTEKTPVHSLRLSFPTADIPVPTFRPLTSFIGFISFTDSTGTALSDGRLPETIELIDYTSARFLFAWNRFRNDEAPLEYGGRISAPEQAPLAMEIHPAIELEFATEVNGHYQIEFSENLKTWKPFGGPINGDGTVYRKLVSTLEIARRNYRVRQISNESEE